MINQSKNKDLNECLKKGWKDVFHYTTLKDNTKPYCETCPATKEYAEKNDAKCYIPRKFHHKIMSQIHRK